MKVVDYGCAMGFFTLPMARMVGETGAVYAVDVQKQMIESLIKRISKAQLEHIIHPVLITEKTDFADLTGKIDFVLLFYMVHEVPDKNELMDVVSKMLKPGGKILFAEPKGHVTAADFKNSVDVAGTAGIKLESVLRIKGSHAALLVKE
jgi:2-polyprenyl-3-methyl-5-hydroxy-6-metoxy-1,4-benzoquinol methylase